MELQTIAIISPGAMGSAVGRTLREHGLRVVTCLEGRSARTRALAQAAGIEALPDYETLVQEADALLSILVPAAAETAAERVAAALTATAAPLIYVDANAIAPQTAQTIGERIVHAGGRFVDGSIIGGPPHDDYTPRIYTSGPDAPQLAQLNAFGLHIIVIDDVIGHASGLKMCYASLTKGTAALQALLMTGARALGVYDALLVELERSQPERLEGMARSIPRLPIKARRFVGEMEEMAKTYAAVGLTPKMLAGAAEMYRLIGKTALADRTPEDDGPQPTLEEALDAFLAAMGK